MINFTFKTYSMVRTVIAEGRKITLIMSFFYFYAFVGAQSCLPSGIVLTEQQDIDDFALNNPGCTEVIGDLTISGSAISNLNGLLQIERVIGGLSIISNDGQLQDLTGLNSVKFVGENLNVFNSEGLTSLTGIGNIEKIDGNLFIQNCPDLIDLNALSKITAVEGNLSIGSNNSLSSLAGLDNLDSLGGHLNINNNISLIDLQGLNHLVTIGEDLSILNNDSLESLLGINSINTIGGHIEIYNNDRLIEISNLSGLETINGGISVRQNPLLGDLSGLDNVNFEGIAWLSIIQNSSLYSCSVQSICDFIDNNPLHQVTVGDNAFGCNYVSEIEAACNSVPVEILNLQAKAFEEFIQISWEVTSGANIHGFEIQRSLTGQDWESLGFLEGEFRNGKMIPVYTFMDYLPNIGTNYYRLSQIDLNGDFVFSNAIEFVYQAFDFDIYPNPTTGGFQFRITGDRATDLTVTLMNTHGTKIWELDFNTDIYKVDGKGVFFVKVESDSQGFVKVLKLISR